MYITVVIAGSTGSQVTVSGKLFYDWSYTSLNSWV